MLPARTNSEENPRRFQGGPFTGCTNTKPSFAAKRVGDKESTRTQEGKFYELKEPVNADKRQEERSEIQRKEQMSHRLVKQSAWV